jgi:hypothetical protein
MTPAQQQALLALLADLYAQLAQAQQRIRDLEMPESEMPT